MNQAKSKKIKKVLLAEDDLVVSQFQEEFLEEMGYCPVLVPDIYTALKVFSFNTFEVIILDLSLPFGPESIDKDSLRPTDGLSLGFYIRNTLNFKGRLLCVSGLTGILADDVRFKVFDGLLDKPFKQDEYLKLFYPSRPMS